MRARPVPRDSRSDVLLTGLFIGFWAGALFALCLLAFLASSGAPAYRYDGLFLPPHG